jgi:hypothetical protein
MTRQDDSKPIADQQTLVEVPAGSLKKLPAGVVIARQGVTEISEDGLKQVSGGRTMLQSGHTPN